MVFLVRAVTTGSATEGKSTGNLSALPFKRKARRNKEILGSTRGVVKPPRTERSLEDMPGKKNCASNVKMS